MNATIRRQLAARKRRIARRIENQPGVEGHQPMMAASNIHQEIAERTPAISPGGIGAIHLMARRIGLIGDIDDNLHLLKRHLPYHESDHVLNIAYNLLAGGSRIEHLEARRNDAVQLDALGATRIPDPTTAGDFGRPYRDKAAALCRRGGSRRVTFRGASTFSRTTHLDRWDADGVRFVVGIDAMPKLVALAEGLDAAAYSELERPARYPITTVPRRSRDRHKERVVSEPGYKTLNWLGEAAAEFEYRPVACRKAYRMIVPRKKLVAETGQLGLFEPDRFFFSITNDRTTPASEVVFLAHDRCDQENLIGQLKGGLKALAMPAGDLVSNRAYLVRASLAWGLKAWAALLLREQGRWAAKSREEKRSLLRMEFGTFCVAMIQVPCQVVRGARRIVYRLLSWAPWQGVFLRLLERLHGRRLC